MTTITLETITQAETKALLEFVKSISAMDTAYVDKAVIESLVTVSSLLTTRPS